MNNPQPEPHTVRTRKSPFVLVQGSILSAILLFILFFIITIFFDYEETLQIIGLLSVLTYESFLILILALLYFVVIIFIFLAWRTTFYEISRSFILVQSGVVFKNEQYISLGTINKLTIRESRFGTIYGYGSILVANPMGKTILVLKNIENPRLYKDIIIRFISELAREQKRERKHVDINQLLSQDESETLEFKSTFRWDLKEDKVNRDLEKAALKSIVGFLNSAGGYLVIGVASDKSVVGLKCDFETLKQKDVDGWENHFNQDFQHMIGIEYRHFLKLQFYVIEGKHICVLQIDPSTKPAFLRSEKDEFYVRNGNITTPLLVRETLSYITEHWL